MQRSRGVSYDTKGKNGKNSKSKQQEITFLLVSANKFGVSLHYNLVTEEVKKILRRNMADWNREAKMWQSSMENYENCYREIQKYANQGEGSKQPIVMVHKIPDFVFKAEQEMKLELEVKNQQYAVAKTVNYNQIETSIEPRVLPFYSKLYDFQKQSLQFGIKKHGRLLLADEMGVGKTIQSLAIISIYRHEWPFLVICPSSLRFNWQQEILNWCGDFIKKSEIQVYAKGGTPIRENIKAMIVSYDLAWKIKDMLDIFKAVIADEAHYLKNTGNKRSDNLMPYLSSRKRIILLTGTPALAKPREIYNLISIVRPDVFINFKEFGYRYCEPTVNPWSRGLQFNGCQNAKELHYILKDRIMIRRLKKEVLTQLPDKQRQKITVETDKNIIKEIKQLLNKQGGTIETNQFENMVLDVLCNFNGAQGQNYQDARAAIGKAYSLTGIAKLESTKEYVLQLLENNIKVILFGHHKAVLDGLQEALNSKKIKHIRIDGTVSGEKRHEYVTAFQEDDRVSVALLSITAAGVGLTLTAASTVVFAELHWTPGMMIQAEDRAHRIGQKNSVNCHYLIGENTLDDILYRFLERKINNVSSFIDGKGDKLKMESMSKGQKGKVSISDNSNSFSKASQTKEKNILFKFESIKPVLNKYFIRESQDTEISESITESIDHEQTNNSRQNRSKRQPYEIQIKEQSGRKQYESEKKPQTPEKEYNNDIDDITQGESSELCRYIIEHPKQMLEYSQKLQSEADSESSF